MGLLACYEVWVYGRSWVRAAAGAIVRGVFHPAMKLVWIYLMKFHYIPNYKFGSRRCKLHTKESVKESGLSARFEPSYGGVTIGVLC